MAIVLNGSTGIQNVLGSASSPAESNTSSSNTGLYFPSSTTLGLSTAGTNALYIDASQNVGIGTTSPSSYGKLTIIPSSQVTTVAGANQLMIGESSQTTNYYLKAGYALLSSTWTGVIDAISGGSGTNLAINPTGGNVGIGTTSPAARLDLGSNFYSGTPSTLSQAINNLSLYAASGTPYYGFGVSSNFLNITGGEATAGIRFNTGGVNERMRIDSSGNLLVGYTSSNGSYKLQVNSQIFATSSTIATSDANYKTNVTPLTGALDLVSKLNPVSFNWKQHPVHDFDTQNTTVGFLAQEVQTALSGQAYVNSIIKESEVTLLDETKEKFLGIAEGNMIAILTKAIQELKAEFDAYKAAHP